MSDTLKWALSKCDKPTSSVELNRAALQAVVDEIADLERRLSEERKWHSIAIDLQGERNELAAYAGECEKAIYKVSPTIQAVLLRLPDHGFENMKEDLRGVIADLGSALSKNTIEKVSAQDSRSGRGSGDAPSAPLGVGNADVDSMPGRWRPASELPPLHKHACSKIVLATDGKNIAMRFYHYADKEWCRDGPKGGWLWEVTHWMPMPVMPDAQAVPSQGSER